MDANNEIIRYKPAKTVEEMTKYLYDNKRVRFNTISEKEAQDILLKYNYINVITPFKHHFAKLDSKRHVIKENGRHVYERDVEFSEYYAKYQEERSKYPIMYKNIMEFEAHFKSIVSYYIVNKLHNKIETLEDLRLFLTGIQSSIAFLKEYSEKRKLHMNKTITDLLNIVDEYHDVYCFFDRISLGQMLTIYIGLDDNTQRMIFGEMKKYNMHLNVNISTQFINKTFMLVGIRNCIMHNNSLEILIRFYDPKEKVLRKTPDSWEYLKFIEQLSKEK